MIEATVQYWWGNTAILWSVEQPALIARCNEMVVELRKRHSVLVYRVVPLLLSTWTVRCPISVAAMQLRADVLVEASPHKNCLWVGVDAAVLPTGHRACGSNIRRLCS